VARISYAKQGFSRDIQDGIMEEHLNLLESLPTSKWVYHEKYLCCKLGMSAKESLPVRKQLACEYTLCSEKWWLQLRRSNVSAHHDQILCSSPGPNYHIH
jgi:hypothetical protein